MSNFYVPISKKHKNDSQVVSHFTLLGSTHVKVAHAHNNKMDPWCQFYQHSMSNFFVVFHSFSLLTIWFCKFFCQKNVDPRKLLVKWTRICDVIYSSLCSYTRTRAKTSRRRWTSSLMLFIRNISQWNFKDGKFHGKPMKPWVNRYATSLTLQLNLTKLPYINYLGYCQCQANRNI
jgi:hypothetical protein